jgi:hypothetical protein
LFETRVVGQNTHELGLYAGAVPLVLCVWLVAQPKRWGSLRPVVLGAILFGGLALLLAAGQFGGIYRLQSLLPLAGSFRFPCRAIVLVQLCLAIGAAAAAVLLFERRPTRALEDIRPSTRPLVFVFLASVALAIVGPLAWPEYVAPAALVWCGPLLVGAAAGLVALAERGARGAAAALVLLTAGDLCTYGLSYSVYGHTARLHDFVAGIPRPPGDVDVRVAVAEDRRGMRAGNRMLLAGLERVDGYAGLEPVKQLDYRRQGALRLAGVRWLLQPDGHESAAPREWLSVQPTAQRARLLTRTAGAEQLDDLERLGLEVAVTDPSLTLDEAPAGTAKVVVKAPGRIAVDTSATTRQLLVMTESYHVGWQATVDGAATQVVRVNGDFLGCVVEPGSRRILLEFRPRTRRVGALLTGCGLILMGISFAFCVGGRGRERSQVNRQN